MIALLSRLSSDRDLFVGKKVVAIGDIAWDRTFCCLTPPAGKHARHSNEQIYDIKSSPDGDDFGSVGSSNNTCLFCQSFGINTYLVSVVGQDDEGLGVKMRLGQQGTRSHILQLPGIQTVSKFRYFVYDPSDDRYDLRYRFDKDPDPAQSEREALRRVKDPAFQTLLRTELLGADALFLNDTQKGFLSEAVLRIIGVTLDEVNRDPEREKARKTKPIITVVDPKYDWKKFRGLPIDVLKANQVEASIQVDLALQDQLEDGYLERLFTKLCDRGFQNYFPRIVITLGPKGAAILEKEDAGVRVHRIPRIAAPSSKFSVATHCGDIFGSALVCALVAGETCVDAGVFANYAASLQYARRTGSKVTRNDLLLLDNIERVNAPGAVAVQAAFIEDKKESLVASILKFVGNNIDYTKHYFSNDGRTSRIVAGPKFTDDLKKLATLIKSGQIVWLHGDSRTGKGAIIEDLSVFVPGFDLRMDYSAAADALASADKFADALRVAATRETCLVLDEIQSIDEAAVSRLLTRFPRDHFPEPFSLILAGHLKQDGNFLDLTRRAKLFEIPPYASSVRRFDLPFLIAKCLKTSPRITRRPRAITAIALRELLRLDYSENWRTLETILTESCKIHHDGDVLRWRDLRGFKKAEVEPTIPGLLYEIELVG